MYLLFTVYLCFGTFQVQRTMLELLNQMDGFSSHLNIKVFYFYLLLLQVDENSSAIVHDVPLIIAAPVI